MIVRSRIMLRNRMLELAIAAAAALGYGCGSPEEPTAQTPEPPKLVQAIRFDCPTPPQDPPKTESKTETPQSDAKAEAQKPTVASMLPPKTPQAGVPRESWKAVPIGETAEKGLKWLVSVQGKDGGW